MAVGPPIVATLRGGEIFTFETGTQEAKITAANLRLYLGGDRAAASIQPERGAHPIKTSNFPNAEFNFRPGDSVTGLQGGLNVNFTFEQIVAGIAAALAGRI